MESNRNTITSISKSGQLKDVEQARSDVEKALKESR